jgi:hypothetical protein
MATLAMSLLPSQGEKVAEGRMRGPYAGSILRKSQTPHPSPLP